MMQTGGGPGGGYGMPGGGMLRNPQQNNGLQGRYVRSRPGLLAPTDAPHI